MLHSVSAPYCIVYVFESDSEIQPFGIRVTLVHKQSGSRQPHSLRLLGRSAEQT